MATDEWITALDEYITQNPNDWIAKWLRGKISPPRRARGSGSNVVEPFDWMRSIITQAAPTQRTTTEWQPTGPGILYPWVPVTKTETVPGAVTGLRPLGAQANVTADQLEQLMYYLGYIKGGGYVPEQTYRDYAKRKKKPLNWGGQVEPYLEMVAYKLPNWWNDYIGLSKSLMPTKSAPRARISARWQR